MAAPPPHNWTGCYIGGNAGGKWWANTSGNVDIQPGIVASTTSFDLSGNNSSNGSFIGGGQVGCNYQASQFVFGIEGDADWQHLSRTGKLVVTSDPVPSVLTDGTFSLSSNWQASLQARFGYAADRVLWYATGTNVHFDGHTTQIIRTIEGVGLVTDVDIVPVSKTAVGGTAGGGVEFAFTDQLTLGLEGRYTWYGSQHFNTLANEDAVAPVTGSLNLNTAEVLGKVNWKFGNFAGNEERRERR